MIFGRDGGLSPWLADWGRFTRPRIFPLPTVGTLSIEPAPPQTVAGWVPDRDIPTAGRALNELFHLSLLLTAGSDQRAVYSFPSPL